MNVTSILDRLKAVALGVILTASATSAIAAGSSVDKSQTSGTEGAQQQKAPLGLVEGSVENLFNFPLADAYWSNGKNYFATLAKRMAEKSYLPEDPNKMQIILPKIYEAAPNGGVFNLAQFAEYMKHSAYDGDQRFKKNGKPILFPRVIIGVVTPPDRLDINSTWRKRLVDAKRIAINETKKLAREKGAAVFEIHRIVAEPGEMIYSERLKRDVELKDAFLIAVGNRYWVKGKNPEAFDRHKKFFATTNSELAQGLDEIFTKELNVMTDQEQMQARVQELDSEIKALQGVQDFLKGKTSADFK